MRHNWPKIRYSFDRWSTRVVSLWPLFTHLDWRQNRLERGFPQCSQGLRQLWLRNIQVYLKEKGKIAIDITTGCVLVRLYRYVWMIELISFTKTDTNTGHEHKCRPVSDPVWELLLKAPVDTPQYKYSFRRRPEWPGRPWSWQRWTLWNYPASSISLTRVEDWHPRRSEGVAHQSHWQQQWLGQWLWAHL